MVITLRDVTLCCQPLMLLKCMLLLGGVLWRLSMVAEGINNGNMENLRCKLIEHWFNADKHFCE